MNGPRHWEGIEKMKPVKAITLTLAGLGMAATMAFADQAEAEGFKIGRIVKQGTHPYFTAETVGMRAAAEELGIELLYQDVQTDTDLTISALDTMIAAGVDAIAITVPDQRSGPAVMARANEAGIVLITPYDPIEDDEGNVAPYIGPSNPTLGRMTGEEGVRIFGELGWASEDGELRVAAIEAQQIEPCMERSDFATAAFLEGDRHRRRHGDPHPDRAPDHGAGDDRSLHCGRRQSAGHSLGGIRLR